MLSFSVDDPDGDHVAVTAWQERGPACEVDVSPHELIVTIPDDVAGLEDIHVIVQAVDSGSLALTGYARFVLTVGSTANQNGTALFEGVTVLFLAQVYGLDLTAGQQVRVMLMSVVAGIGTAGVPGGSLPMVMIVAQSVGVPAEGMALVLGVDRFLDMCRTAVNVSGDLVIAALVGDAKVGDAKVGRSEGLRV